MGAAQRGNVGMRPSWPELPLGAASIGWCSDWTVPYRHSTFSKAVFRPAILRANRMFPATLPEGLVMATPRTPACALRLGGIPPMDLAVHGPRQTEHRLGLRPPVRENHEPAMTALGAMRAPITGQGNVIPFARLELGWLFSRYVR